MKKLVLTLLLVAACDASALAQKGMQGSGLAVGYSYFGDLKEDSHTLEASNAVAPGIKYYYFLSDHFRVEPSAYYFSNGDASDSFGITGGLINLSAQYMLTTTNVKPYLFGRIIYAHIAGKYNSGDRAGYGLGAGVECRVAYNWSLQADVAASKFSHKPDHGKSIGWMVFPSLAVIYNF